VRLAGAGAANPAGAGISVDDYGYNSGYTMDMKTAVSMPDDLFQEAEAAALRLRVSRSELYAKAIAAFLAQHSAHAITDRLNDVYSRHTAKLDSALHLAQLKSLDKDAW
jgi:metal-responsive CopG/Arc/MetJ family transcriptional regulator